MSRLRSRSASISEISITFLGHVFGQECIERNIALKCKFMIGPSVLKMYAASSEPLNENALLSAHFSCGLVNEQEHSCLDIS